MRRILILFSSCIVILLTIIFCIFFYFYHSPAKEFDDFEIQHPKDDTLRIAFIGDSWAFFHQFHTCKLSSLLTERIKKPVKVISDGTCGASSKFIYSRIGANGHINEIIKEGPDYCIIAAGVNDTHMKIGEKYYLQNMKLIINFMFHHNITPIILEIPDYDIFKVYNDANPLIKILRHMSMAYTGTRMDCRDDYRKALRKMLKNNYLDDKYLLLRYDDWNSNANHDIDKLYREDRIHLNDKGYEFLDSCLSNIILSNYVYYEDHL